MYVCTKPLWLLHVYIWISQCSGHVQNQYCDSDFVLKLTIKNSSATTASPFQIYAISIKAQIKVTPNFTKLYHQSLEELWFQPDVTMNNLESSEKYIMTGKILTMLGKRKLVTRAGTDWIQPWNQISHLHKAYLHKQVFDANCACKINSESKRSQSCTTARIISKIGTDSLPNASLPANNSATLSASSDAVGECYARYAYCAVRAQMEGDLRCAWTKSRHFDACAAKAEWSQSKHAAQKQTKRIAHRPKTRQRKGSRQTGWQDRDTSQRRQIKVTYVGS